MKFTVLCKLCSHEFELYSGRDGRLCTCPKCFSQGRLKATEPDRGELEVEGETL